MKNSTQIDFLERIPGNVSTNIGIWAISHDVPIMFSDIPEYLFRKEIMKNEGVLEMRELLSEACQDIILDPEISTLTPYFGAIHRYPDIMLHYNDRYTAALINHITKEYSEFKNIAVICGHGQTKSIPTYLQFSTKSLFE